MTVNEAIEAAGPGFKLEGLTDGKRVIGFRVLSHDRRVIAVFKGEDHTAPAQPLASGAGTSSL
jgi:hypothetical protein